MTRAHKVLGVLLVTVAGLLGCAKAPTPAPSSGASEAKPQAAPGAEARLHKLEEEVRTLAAARDAARQKLVAAEGRAADLERQLGEAKAAAARDLAAMTAERDVVAVARDGLSRERDVLQAALKTRTVERDSLHTQFVSYLDEQAERIARQKAALLVMPSAPPVSASQNPPTALQN